MSEPAALSAFDHVERIESLLYRALADDRRPPDPRLSPGRGGADSPAAARPIGQTARTRQLREWVDGD